MLIMEKQNSRGQILQGAISIKYEHVRGSGALETGCSCLFCKLGLLNAT